MPTICTLKEEVVRNQDRNTVEVHAKFDGRDYPVIGSPAANVIAYRRLDFRNISGSAKKNGAVTLTESINVSGDGTVMTQNFSILRNGGVVVSGIAVFQKIPD